MLSWALRYARLGMSVIPLKSRSKEPLIPWQEFQKRRATEAEIRSWFANTANINIGIVTGIISGVVVVDIDGQKAVEKATSMSLKSSIVSITGSGYRHLWYRYPEKGIESKRLWKGQKEHEEIFLRSDDLYVVAPPSIHPNGKRYRWQQSQGLNVKESLPFFPTHLWNVQNVDLSNKKPDNWINKALEEIENGHVHNTLVSVLGKFRNHNFDSRGTIRLLAPIVQKGGMSLEELETKVNEIWGRYEPGPIKPSIRMDSTRFSNAAESTNLVIHSPTNSDSWKQYEQRSIKYESSKILRTGYAKLDEMLAGGLNSSRLFVLASRTGVGKTNWILAAARRVCETDKVVLLFSTEMPYEEIWTRYIAALKDAGEFSKHKFYVCDSFAPNLDKVEEIIAKVKPDLFIFDHINHVAEDVRPLGEFIQGLNWLKRKYDCAGIVTAQLNRAADWVDLKTGEKVTPRMSMIKGSGTIEQAASRVLLLSEIRVLPEYTEIVGNLDKNDNGQKGIVHFGLYNNPWRMEQL